MLHIKDLWSSDTSLLEENSLEQSFRLFPHSKLLFTSPCLFYLIWKYKAGASKSLGIESLSYTWISFIWSALQRKNLMIIVTDWCSQHPWNSAMKVILQGAPRSSGTQLCSKLRVRSSIGYLQRWIWSSVLFPWQANISLVLFWI